MPHVKIYTMRGCPYCTMAKSLLTRKGVRFEEVVAGRDPEVRAWLEEVTGQDTVPQVFVDGRSLGGFSDIDALDRKGELDPILRGET